MSSGTVRRVDGTVTALSVWSVGGLSPRNCGGGSSLLITNNLRLQTTLCACWPWSLLLRQPVHTKHRGESAYYAVLSPTLVLRLMLCSQQKIIFLNGFKCITKWKICWKKLKKVILSCVAVFKLIYGWFKEISGPVQFEKFSAFLFFKFGMMSPYQIYFLPFIFVWILRNKQ